MRALKCKRDYGSLLLLVGSYNNMKNIEDGEPLNILPFIDRSSLTIAFDKKGFKDLGLGSVAQSVLISDCVINNAKFSDSFGDM